MSILHRTCIFLLLAFSLACKNDAVDKPQDSPAPIAIESIDENLADSLIQFFKSRYLLDDMQFLHDDTTEFQFYKIDLTDDDQYEIFVRFMGPYFCGAGGCTYAIFDQKLTELNRFTSTRAPIIVSDQVENGWKVLYNQVDEEMKVLVNKNNRYPSNPSMAPSSNFNSSEGSVYLFDETKNPSKTYSF